MEPDYCLEPARQSDARAIAEMSRDLIEHGLPWRWRPEAVLRLLHDPDTAVLAARAGASIRGFAIMIFNWKVMECHLVLLAVAPSERRQGLGGEMLRWLEVVARRGGIRRVALEVRAGGRAARRFYEGLGYTETGRVVGYYQGREDAVTMAKSLAVPIAARRTGHQPS